MFLCAHRCGATDIGGHGEHALLLTNLYATELGQHVVSDNDNKTDYIVEYNKRVCAYREDHGEDD